MISRPLVRLMDRYLPDPYIFVLILTVSVAAAAMIVEAQSPLAVVRMWGDGFWSLLQFSMQMLLVLVTGYMMASTPLVRRGLSRLADLATSPGAAILLVSYVSLAASWLNWGFGLVVGALFAKEIARKVRVDYRLLVASAYSGFLIWHGGLAGSIPLAIATDGHTFSGQIGVIGTGQTIFSVFNLAIVLALVVIVPLVNRAMLPPESESVYVDPKLLGEPSPETAAADTPSERMMDSKLLPVLVGLSGLAYLVDYFLRSGTLTLNIVNFLFLMVAIVLHGSARNLLASLAEGVKGGAGIVIQFPFYAGIMAIMVSSGLAATISDALARWPRRRACPSGPSSARASSISSCRLAAGNGRCRRR
ncbi:short-chain fatty acid transporter [Mangrovicoccus ximenensis]|uniref:short-chain fatty acid transporter n=1 Tax=Mangrovicoccus ximenensis TaxID=1911570 RepID=UPI0022AAFBC8|nr:TIGR00366 family protein [Mangrovicoccus ximenensis]